VAGGLVVVALLTTGLTAWGALHYERPTEFFTITSPKGQVYKIEANDEATASAAANAAQQKDPTVKPWVIEIDAVDRSLNWAEAAKSGGAALLAWTVALAALAGMYCALRWVAHGFMSPKRG
jgi:hypothetical protein